MHVQEPAGAGAFVQVVDILGAEEEIAAGRRQIPFEPGERLVGGIGAGCQKIAAPEIVEGVNPLGIGGEGLGRREPHRIEAVPDAARIAEGPEPAFRGNPGAGENEDPHHVQPVLPRASLDPRAARRQPLVMSRAYAPRMPRASDFHNGINAMGRLVIASNRTATPGESKAGGLAVALWDALTERGGGLWFGWSGETVERESRGVRLASEGSVEFALADLTEREHEGYYLGYSNRALWPVCHYRIDLARFHEEDFEQYGAVNRRFACLMQPLLRPGDRLWVHDYHLFLLGQELRNTGWRGPIGFFLHIPFPAPEVFSALPQHPHLARGLAEFDLLGFQTERDTRNFVRYMVEQHGAREIGPNRLEVFDRTIEARAFPIGIDPAEIARFAVSEDSRSDADRLSRLIENRALVLGVDRMDYSKGLPQRLQAFGHLLDEHQDLCGHVTLLQIAPPSREDVGAYQDLREELDRLAGRINSTYSDLAWTPIRYLARGFPRETLAGLYRLARVGLVTPLYDGMNLVAKEYVAAQDPEDPGVLVLSEFAGAAEQLQAALIVNPYDIGAMADAIHRGLTMSREERRERWQELNAAVTEGDIARWRRDFLARLEAVPAGEG
jgi:trehalose 6-phosphate synthase